MVDAVEYDTARRVEAGEGPPCGSHEAVGHARRVVVGPSERSRGIDGCSRGECGARRVERSEAAVSIAQEAALRTA